MNSGACHAESRYSSCCDRSVETIKISLFGIVVGVLSFIIYYFVLLNFSGIKLLIITVIFFICLILLRVMRMRVINNKAKK